MKTCLTSCFFLFSLPFAFCQTTFNIGDAPATDACIGTLYDSGGPGGDYANFEDHVFTICPTAAHECIVADIVSLNAEEGFDSLLFYAGADVNASLIAALSGFASNLQLQFHSDCLTVRFVSDFSTTDSGFEMHWQCTPDACTIPEPITCDNAVPVPALPFSANGLTTCNSGNNIGVSPCNDDDFLATEDYIFAYQSPGDECISVRVTGSIYGTGVAIYDGCGVSATNCIAVNGSTGAQTEPFISSARLDAPGEYFIVVDNANFCTPFNLEIAAVTCPVVFPSAARCEAALSLEGCGALPALVSIAPGGGDSAFIQQNINNGCWGNIFPVNYTFFIFRAEADGEFAFTMQAANADEASDLDFSIWGPIENEADICQFAATHQPARSSFAGGADLTGLAHIHPLTALPVNDVCEDQSGDDFVQPLPVETGKFYLVLLNDWGESILSGAVSMDFSGTTAGVFDTAAVQFSLTADTAVCTGQTVTLTAAGGQTYEWLTTVGIPCPDCPSATVAPTVTTTYEIAIHTLCFSDTLAVTVEVVQAALGITNPDSMALCKGDSVALSVAVFPQNALVQWLPDDGSLSAATGVAILATPLQSTTYVASISLPGCAIADTVFVQIDSLPLELDILPPVSDICQGEMVYLTSPVYEPAHFTGIRFQWLPFGGQLTPDSLFNMVVQPADTTEYQRITTLGACADTATAVVNVKPVAALVITPDAPVLCPGSAVQLAVEASDASITQFNWEPSVGLSCTECPNPVAAPSVTTSYQVKAEWQGCPTAANVTVTVSALPYGLPPDTDICPDEAVLLNTLTLPGATYHWTSADGSFDSTDPQPVVSPAQTTTYFLEATNGNCVFTNEITIEVWQDFNLTIMPDTTACLGEPITLTAAASQPGVLFSWEDVNGNTINPPLATSGSLPQTFFLEATDPGNCFVKTESVTIAAYPDFTLSATSDFTIQAGQTANLEASADLTGVLFSWKNRTTAEVVSNTANAAIVLCENTEFEVVATHPNGCPSKSRRLQVTVEEAFSIEKITLLESTADTMLYEGEPFSLSVTLSPPQLPGATFEWYLNDSLVATTTDTFLPGLQAPEIFEDLDSLNFTVVVTDAAGCEKSETGAAVVHNNPVDFPNVFTPNGDMVNDFFLPVSQQPVSIVELKIWNRWGQLVYDNASPGEGWNGEQGGKPAVSDVYVYSVKYRIVADSSAVYSQKGEVTLLR